MSEPDDSGVGGYLWIYATGARDCSDIAQNKVRKEEPVSSLLRRLWSDEQGQDIAEYAVMLAVILVIVVGTIRLIGTNSNTIFSQVGSAIQ
jgi:Flp pilus assembly pilin Flp